MTAAGLPTEDALSAWHRRFPARRHLWAGRLRLWRVELAVRPPTTHMTDWATKAASGHLGLPPAVVAAAAADTRPHRRTFAFLDLPPGPVPVVVPATTFAPWPEPVESVPAAVLRPAGVEAVPPSGNWRTVPVVRVEAVDVVAVGTTGRIDVYPADGPNDKALWELPPDALPAAGPAAWTAAWRAWVHDRGHSAAGVVAMRDGVAVVTDFGGSVPDGLWLWAGDGSLREAAQVEVRGAS
jgi:hypothetical protein